MVSCARDQALLLLASAWLVGTARAQLSLFNISYHESDEHILRPMEPRVESSSDLELTMLLLFFSLLLALVVVCSLYSVCSSSESGKCCFGSHVEGQPFDAMMTHSPSYFREDLLNEDEILRLWICFYCDFANYEMKTHCALCGNDKHEKEKAQSIRPASLFSSMATTMSSSRSLSPSFLLASSSSPRDRSVSAPAPLRMHPLEASRTAASSSFDEDLTPQPVPRSPTGTPMAMLKRRREWLPELSASTGNVVWTYSSQQDCRTAQVPEKLILQTAFVTHNIITQDHPHGRLEFVPAQGAQVYGSSRPEYYNSDSNYLFLDPFAIDAMRSLSFPEKHRWFMQETTAILHVRWGNPTLNAQTSEPGTTSYDGLTLVVPRDNLFHGSMQALISVSQKQLHRPLRVKFVNEPGIDAGGVVREWFSLVMAAFLDESNGLFKAVHTSASQDSSGLAYTIHPTASICVADYLLYYRAFGRLVGKALLEGHLIPVPLADFLLKHILSVPVSFADLQALDESLGRSMLLLWQTPLDDDGDDDDDDPYALDFSVYHTAMGVVDLKPNGRNIAVTEANKHEYIALYSRWHLGESIAEEVAALVSGVYDVMPIHLLAPFDYQELRLMLCGLPSVDVDDWEKSTVIIGKKSSRHARVVSWFWKLVRAMPMEQRCRLLQFATGAARVPVQGFKALTSSDGRLCPFTLYCVPKEQCEFIRAYTCFNRLDIPLYKSEKELENALHLVLQMDITGFSIQ